MIPRVELVTTGAELLNGRVVNRHAAWLGGALDQIGWRLERDTTVADQLESIRDAITFALSRCDVVIVTGGLGPTTDDVTRDVAAEWFGAPIIMHEPTRQVVLEAYRSRNKPLNATVERHALVVAGAEVLDNRHGLAAGQHLTRAGKHLFLLPGPPREFQGVMRDHVLPWFIAQAAAPSVRRQCFQVAGLGESDIAARLESSGFEKLRIETAYCAEPGRVAIRMAEVIGAPSDFDAAICAVRNALADHIYAETEELIEEVVGRLLRAQGKTIAVAESCTGGLIGQRLTAIPGSSAYVRGGVIAYHNEVKSGVLGVPEDLLRVHGAVSEPVAAAMADGVRSLTASDIGVSVTGIAGPDGGTPEKPVGLVFIAVADGHRTRVEKLRLGGGRDVIRESAATMALDLARKMMENRY